MSSFSRLALALFFVLAGIAHFIAPGPYLAIMPPSIPWPAAMIAVSGAAEILGGFGVCFRSTRRAAGWWLIALLIAIFPANVYAISIGMVIGDNAVPSWMLWARLPLQLVLIAWVWRACLGHASRRPRFELRSERGWKASHLRL
ncbi:MAG: hypothetical protein M3N48_06210 [Verrucomicrobiota bacterium]|nr:hypothetical protein [Verrucomicrobiota bacterium]